jgi:hypothetical protein
MGGRCLDKNCTKQAVFNLKGESKGQLCKQHKTPEMIDVVNPKCQYENCFKQPCYNYPGEKKGNYCKFHRLEGMIDIKDRKYCEQVGCKTRACFNLSSENVPRFCSTHKSLGMVDVVKVTCLEDGCDITPIFGFKYGRPINCKTHKKEGMIDLRHGVSCLECTKRPTFNFSGETSAIYCVDHKRPEMVNVLENRLCKDCPRRAYYGNMLNGPIYCKDHKKDGMLWVVKTKKCHLCEKAPTYGYEKSKPIACRDHKNDDMKDVTHVSCKTPLCEIRPVKAGYCSRCYIYMFPDSKVTRNFKTKELAVREFLKVEFPSVTLVHDKRVDCFLYRPDFSIDMGSHVIIIEVDENQHETYDLSCNNKRLMSIFKSFGSRPIIMIRFNPDKYDNIKGCWTTDCKIRDSNKWNDRLEKLSEKIKFSMCTIPEKEVTLIHLFYDKV